MREHRAVFDFHISFTNGGGLEGTGFRLDVPGPKVTHQEVAALLVRSLGLLMTGSVEIVNLTVVDEPHRGTRGAEAPATTGRRLVELSHAIGHGVTTYPGLPGPEISDHLTREAAEAIYGAGVRFQIGRLSMVGNTGTYLDSPFHRFDDGVDLAGLPLSQLADLEGVVIRVVGSDRRAIDVSELLPYDVAGRAVLIHTAWDRNWGLPEYGVDAPFVTKAATEWLIANRAALVGIDSVNIDNIDDRSRPVHTGLLRAGIPIVEHLGGLDQLPVRGFRFHAAPPRVENFGTFPVRAYAIVP
jgi:arylformamidase